MVTPKHVRNLLQNRLFIAVLVVLAVAPFGFKIIISRAATNAITLEAEQGVTSTYAGQISDDTASGKQAVRFGMKYSVKQLTNPTRTEAYDSAGNWLATFTNFARTVTLKGPSRTFAEPTTTTATVSSTTWVRLYPTVFKGAIDESWLDSALNDTSPDILQISMQYVDMAPELRDSAGLKIAGDADYGQLQPDGTRQEGSDFNDYLGIPWKYGTATDQPEATQLGNLDCSGFQRMVWGYRSGMAMSADAGSNALLGRSAYQIYASAPGIFIMYDKGVQLTSLSRLQPGDIVFHDTDPQDGTQIDHMGMYLGIDDTGHYRFISSRKSANGPTMGDFGGSSILDGSGLYATTFRAVLRF
jgi:cell wall-associated NlpC family hydrolase